MIVAITTLYINYSVLVVHGAPDYDSDKAITLLDELIKIIAAAQDAEALYRALVGVGTLLSLGKDFRDLAREALGFEEAIKKVKQGKAGSEPRMKAVITEMEDVQ